MPNILLEAYDPRETQGEAQGGHRTVHDEDEDSSDGAFSNGAIVSHRLMRRRATCRYFENYSPTVKSDMVLRRDYFYQEHLKSGHFSFCEPLMAPNDDMLPEEPPLRAEVPFCLMTRRLIPVKLRDKLLSSRHIRLVGLHPPDHPDDSQRYSLRPQARRLRCEVYQASLDDISSDGEPLFAALSYVCGSPALTHHVWCGQEYVTTTQNLFEALLHVRYEDRPRLLWADGLCIDQKNTEERNHQVGMLHEIYSQAHVITWLGTGYQTDLTVLATFLSQTARVYTEFVRSRGTEFDVRSSGQDPNQSCMDEILHAEYFNRVWVAQEIFLGKSVTCQLGIHTFSIAVLAATLASGDYHFRQPKNRDPEDIRHSYLDPTLTGIWYPFFTTMRDLTIVQEFGSKGCADPRDHIYGLSALFDTRPAYPVDYSLSVAEVFCNFAVHCLKTLNDVSIFWMFRGITQRPHTAPPAYECTAGFIDDNDFVLPSWCPSWTHCGVDIARSLGMEPQDRWCASEGRSLRLDRPSPLVITLEGCIVSKVVWCSTNIVTWPSAGTLIKETVEYLLHLPRHLPLPSCAQDLDLTRLVLSILKLLLWHPCFDAELVRGSSIYSPELFHITQTFLEEGKPWASFFGPVYLQSAVPDLFSSMGIEIDPRISVEAYEDIIMFVRTQMHEASDGCCLFVTDDGMLGTGFPGMMAGDLVCVLFGGDVPYVLRPTEIEGQYLLIGECYVEELMEGEAMVWDLPEQRFTLV
jgi:hypothetical protein